MCGIAGMFNTKSEENIRFNEGIIRRMCDLIRYRGPDDEGYLLDRNIALGMRRLSIIDIRGGAQPMSNEDKSVWVICNGEIYNYLELRQLLQKKGHLFRTHSDIETIVHLYEEFGDGFVSKLNGMFAIALWDKKSGKLILVRDRLGIKPLFYSISGNKIIFSSEMKSILVDKDISRDIDFEALDRYFSFFYIPAPFSIFKSIRKLLPGHMLVAQNGSVSISKYWDLYDYQFNQEPRDENYYSEKLLDLLKDSIKLMLQSEVPLGIFLSGGIDSGSIVALMSEVTSKKFKTFSIGFEESSYSELNEARATSDMYGTEHFEYIIRPRNMEIFSRLLHYFDEPFGAYTTVQHFLLCKYAKEQITVALAGDGGDELFGGYQTYTAYNLARRYRQLPKCVRNYLIKRIVQVLPVSDRRLSFDFKAKQFISGADLDYQKAHFIWKVIFDDAAKEMLYSPLLKDATKNFRAFGSYETYFNNLNNVSELDKLMYTDMKVFLPDSILAQTDRMSMANALETRVPFLDHRLVEFASSIPVSLKVRGFNTKYILKKAMKGLLPQRNIRIEKKGFTTPVPVWINGDLKNLVTDILSKVKLKRLGLFNIEYVERVLEEHFRKKKDNNRQIWTLLSFVGWHDSIYKG